MNNEIFRKDFPILRDDSLIYFDSATASLVPTYVLETVQKYYETIGVVVKRGTYKLTIEATDRYERARSKVAAFFGVAPAEISFVPNESYGISSLLYSLPWKKGDRIITTLLEHHSNYLPLLYLATRFGIELDYIPHTSEGELNPETLESSLSTDIRLISLTYSPLLFGTRSPVESIVQIAHEYNIPVLIDGTRIVGHLPIDLKALGCDFFICDGNIGLLGPQGIGVLYINQDSNIQLNPPIIGSGTVSKVQRDSYHLMDFPNNYESGNPNVAGALGLEAAIEYLKKVGLENIRSHEEHLIKKLVEGLSTIPNVQLYGPTDPSLKNSIISFNIDELNPHDSAMFLDEAANIAVRSGRLCSHPMLNEFNLPGVVQASLHLYNSDKDVIKFLETVETIAKELA
ncbi:MAG: aminotransferase class V-fold PLP-dependent enzyme [Candidatus Helarchaeota archaeon]